MPDSPDIKIIGILKYEAGKGIELQLEGTFTTLEHDTLHGFASGHYITLLGSFNTNWVDDFFDYAPSRVVANKALIGVNYTEDECNNIDSVCVEYGDLKKWTKHSGFHSRFEGSKYYLEYECPEPIVLYEDKNVIVEMKSYAEGISSPLPEKAVIYDKNYFTIKSKCSENNLDHIKYTDALRKFISLASRVNIDYTDLYFRTNDTNVSILFSYPKINIQYPSKSLDRIYSFFNFPAVKDDISNHFQKWLHINSNAPEVLGLYFYTPDGMSHQKFVSIAQALEDFHRKFLNPTKNKDSSYINVIKDIFKRFESVSKIFDSDADRFSELVRDHRDYYTHWFEKKKYLVLEGLPFDILRRDINLLLEMCLLEQCGFSVNEVHSMVEKCMHYKTYINQR